MRLLSLSANKASFRTVTFNPVGLSLIVAEQRSSKSARTNTYNGVGKTLILALLHYCLGSSKRAGFEKHLKGWEFKLTIDVEGTEHTIRRKADKPNDISLDGHPLSVTKLRDFLEEAAFESSLNISHLSFRSVISQFVRASKSAYVDFKYTDEADIKDPYGALLRISFLLGLDLDLVKTKHDLRTRKVKLTETMRQLEKEPLFAKLLAEDSLDIELTTLKEEAVRLEQQLRDFRVAEDYHEIEVAANKIKRQLDLSRREEVKFTEAIAQIDRSLENKGDLSSERVFRLYAEAQIALPRALRRNIDEVIAFQKDLQTKRAYRLSKERAYRLSKERQELARGLLATQSDVRRLSTQLDDKLRYLNEHRALDEYVAVNAELSDIRQRLTALEQSKKLRDQVDQELKKIDLSFATENIRTAEYLQKTARPLIDEASQAFRSFTRELYGSRPSGLTVLNDDGENQQRYRIDAHISADRAEGINEAKIFCVDAVLLSLRRGHRIQFLAHDSTLFGPIDSRQRMALLRIADKVCRQFKMQYIATLNHHDIISITEQLPSENSEWQKFFADGPVILRLTDEQPGGKLLGIDVDMDYTK